MLRGSDTEGDAADKGGGDPSSSLTRALEKTPHGLRAFASDELVELADKFPADGLGAEDHPRDRGSNEQHWRDRKQRVVGEGRAESRGIIIPPGP